MQKKGWGIAGYGNYTCTVSPATPAGLVVGGQKKPYNPATPNCTVMEEKPMLPRYFFFTFRSVMSMTSNLTTEISCLNASMTL